MKPIRILLALLLLVLILGASIFVGLHSSFAKNRDAVPDPSPEAIASVLSRDPGAQPFKLNHHNLTLRWAVTGVEEQGCSGSKIGGGELTGNAQFSQVGKATLEFSAAWDIDHLIQGPGQFTPVGPASGPIAPVLGQASYPYTFEYDPEAGNCQGNLVATGQLTLVAANGDQVFGRVTGGEAHKLRFLIDGDGVETFAITEVTGGTGRFEGATGSFVAHSVARSRFIGGFDLTLLEILPGGILQQ